jgi:hypothetical protein
VTHDPDEYGNYVGVPESYQQEFMGRFFPEEISSEFQNVTYCYASRPIDLYGFEAYLEFTIEDPAVFEAHVASATAGMRRGVFWFEPSYEEYVLPTVNQETFCDLLLLNSEKHDEETGSSYYTIEYAKIAKILVNKDEQRIIYVAMGVYDGGASDTVLLGTYFERFQIDPEEYEEYSFMMYP